MLIRREISETKEDALPLLMSYLEDYNPLTSLYTRYLAATLLNEAAHTNDNEEKINKINAAEALCPNIGPTCRIARAGAYLALSKPNPSKVLVDLNISVNEEDPYICVMSSYLRGISYLNRKHFALAQHCFFQAMRKEWENNIPSLCESEMHTVLKSLAEWNTANLKIIQSLSAGIETLVSLAVPSEKVQKVIEKKSKILETNEAQRLLEKDNDLQLMAWRFRVAAQEDNIKQGKSTALVTSSHYKMQERARISKELIASANKISGYLGQPTNGICATTTQISKLSQISKLTDLYEKLDINPKMFTLFDFMHILKLDFVDMQKALHHLNPNISSKTLKAAAVLMTENYDLILESNPVPMALAKGLEVLFEEFKPILFPLGCYFLQALNWILAGKYKEALDALEKIIPLAADSYYYLEKNDSTPESIVIKNARYMYASCLFNLENKKLKGNFKETVRYFHHAVSADSDIRSPALTSTSAREYLKLLFAAMQTLQPKMDEDRLKRTIEQATKKSWENITQLEKFNHVIHLLNRGDALAAFSTIHAIIARDPYISASYPFIATVLYDNKRYQSSDLKTQESASINAHLNLSISVILGMYIDTQEDTLAMFYRHLRNWHLEKGELLESQAVHERLLACPDLKDFNAENEIFSTKLEQRGDELSRYEDKLIAYLFANQIFESKQITDKINDVEKLIAEAIAPAACAIAAATATPEVASAVHQKEQDEKPVSAKAKRKADKKAKAEAKIKEDEKKAELEKERAQRKANNKREEDEAKTEAKIAKAKAKKERRIAAEERAQEAAQLEIARAAAQRLLALREQLNSVQQQLITEQESHRPLVAEVKMQEKQKTFILYQVKQFQQKTQKNLQWVLKNHYIGLQRQTWLTRAKLLQALKDDKQNTPAMIVTKYYQEWVNQAASAQEALLQAFTNPPQYKDVAAHPMPVDIISIESHAAVLDLQPVAEDVQFETESFLSAQLDLRQQELDFIQSKNRPLRAIKHDLEEEIMLIQSQAKQDLRRVLEMQRELLEEHYQKQMQQAEKGQAALLRLLVRVNGIKGMTETLQKYFWKWMKRIKRNQLELIQSFNLLLNPPQDTTRIAPLQIGGTDGQLQIGLLQRQLLALQNANLFLCQQNHNLLYGYPGVFMQQQVVPEQQIEVQPAYWQALFHSPAINQAVASAYGNTPPVASVVTGTSLTLFQPKKRELYVSRNLKKDTANDMKRLCF